MQYLENLPVNSLHRELTFGSSDSTNVQKLPFGVCNSKASRLRWRWLGGSYYKNVIPTISKTSDGEPKLLQ